MKCPEIPWSDVKNWNIKIVTLHRMTKNSRHFMKCQTGPRHSLKSAPIEYIRYLGLTWNAQARASTFRIILARRRRRERTSSYCRKRLTFCYIADHFTAECSTLRFYNYAFATFLCCIVCATIVLLEWNRVPKLAFPRSHFMKKMQFQAYLRFISLCTEVTFLSGWYTALEHFGICTF